MLRQKRKDPNSILSYYKRLISIRKKSNALTLGDPFKSLYAKRGLFAFSRSDGNDTYFILLVNMTKNTNGLNMYQMATIVLTNYKPDGSKHLRPFEAMIIEVEKMKSNKLLFGNRHYRKRHELHLIKHVFLF